MNNTSRSDAVVAAGAVCWRVETGKDGTGKVGTGTDGKGTDGKGKIKVLLVHREAQADVSLPKGKVDAGELLPHTAVREIDEETGLNVALGVPLGSIQYTIGNGRDKIVHYWVAEVTDEAYANSHFSPNQEIAALEWLTVDKARAALSYERDRDVLDRFAALVETGNHRTFALIAVRHGKAVPPSAWDGPDSSRPLLHRGLDQVASIAPAIAAFHPVKLISSTAARCQATLAPLASLTGLPVTATDDISQDAYENHTAKVGKVVRKRLEKKVSAVLCSHGPVLPEIIETIAKDTGSRVDGALRYAAQLSTAEFSVLHISLEHPEAGILAIETHSPLPGH